MNPADFITGVMAHSAIENYIVPGLTSSLIGGTPETGKVRLFEASRHQHAPITPHSHRYAFRCLVLKGKATNRVWKEISDNPNNLAVSQMRRDCDEFDVSELVYSQLGSYEKSHVKTSRWYFSDNGYTQGEWYGMEAEEVHSITFSRDAVVLFFEGPNTADRSIVLEPAIAAGPVETLRTEPWMFQKRVSRQEASFSEVPEMIVCAANRYPCGTIALGARHFDAMMHEQIDRLGLRGRILQTKTPEQGFWTTKDRFVSREEALEIALASGQRRFRCGGDEKKLFSENLY